MLNPQIFFPLYCPLSNNERSTLFGILFTIDWKILDITDSGMTQILLFHFTKSVLTKTKRLFTFARRAAWGKGGGKMYSVRFLSLELLFYDFKLYQIYSEIFSNQHGPQIAFTYT